MVCFSYQGPLCSLNTSRYLKKSCCLNPKKKSQANNLKHTSKKPQQDIKITAWPNPLIYSNRKLVWVTSHFWCKTKKCRGTVAKLSWAKIPVYNTDIKLITKCWFSILVLMQYMSITWILVPLVMSSTHLHTKWVLSACARGAIEGRQRLHGGWFKLVLVVGFFKKLLETYKFWVEMHM